MQLFVNVADRSTLAAAGPVATPPAVAPPTPRAQWVRLWGEAASHFEQTSRLLAGPSSRFSLDLAVAHATEGAALVDRGWSVEGLALSDAQAPLAFEIAGSVPRVVRELVTEAAKASPSPDVLGRIGQALGREAEEIQLVTDGRMG